MISLMKRSFLFPDECLSLGYSKFNEWTECLSYMNSYVEILSSNVMSLGGSLFGRYLDGGKALLSGIVSYTREVFCPFCHVRTQ